MQEQGSAGVDRRDALTGSSGVRQQQLRIWPAAPGVAGARRQRAAGGVAQLVPRHQGGVRTRHVEPLLGEVPGAVSEVVRRVINARGWGSVGWLTSQRGGRGGAQPMACLGRAGGTQPNRRQQR